MNENIISFIIIAAILFFVCRMIILWYWKIPERIENQEKLIGQNRIIIDILEDVNSKLKK